MKTLLTAIFIIFTGCCTPRIKTVYVDKVATLGCAAADVFIALEIKKPNLRLFTGSLSSYDSQEKTATGEEKLMSFAEDLLLENKRMKNVINQCRKGEKK